MKPRVVLYWRVEGSREHPASREVLVCGEAAAEYRAVLLAHTETGIPRGGIERKQYDLMGEPFWEIFGDDDQDLLLALTALATGLDQLKRGQES